MTVLTGPMGLSELCRELLQREVEVKPDQATLKRVVANEEEKGVAMETRLVSLQTSVLMLSEIEIFGF